MTNRDSEFRESQYNELIDIENRTGRTELGIMRNYDWNVDPKRFVFTFARYKFVSKIFEGFSRVLEIGCGDGFATRLVQQTVGHVTVTDFDPIFIDDIKARMDPDWPLEAKVHDFLDRPLNETFDGVFCLDVLEHIEPSNEPAFLRNSIASLNQHGTFIVGMPSLESQPYASGASRIGHVNCKSGSELKRILKNYFHSVFIFSMNDEVVHTGFYPMAHYLIAVCCDKR